MDETAAHWLRPARCSSGARSGAGAAVAASAGSAIVVGSGASRRRRSSREWARVAPPIRRRHEADRAFPAGSRQLVDAVDVAADAEAAIAAEAAVAVEHRQAGQFDRQPFAGVVRRPGNDDAAPGFARRHRLRDLIVRIELEVGGDLAPQPAECGHGSRSHQFDEFVRAEAEAAVRIHLPDEPQRVTPLRDRSSGVDAAARTEVAGGGAAAMASGIASDFISGIASGIASAIASGTASEAASGVVWGAASAIACGTAGAMASAITSGAVSLRTGGVASLGCGDKASTRTREASLPRRVAVISTEASPKRVVPLAVPRSSAVATSASMPSADSVVMPESRVCAAALA